MNNNGLFTMSSQELDRKNVFDRVLNRELTQVQAAKMIGVSDRRVRKLLSNYIIIWHIIINLKKTRTAQQSSAF